jgi:hypothetical protein
LTAAAKFCSQDMGVGGIKSAGLSPEGDTMMRSRATGMTIAVLSAGVALWSTGLHAAPITYTESATVSGTLGNTSFTNALITITGTGDTTGVFNDGNFRNNVSASFSIAGDGSGTFTDAIQTFVNQTFLPTPAAGFDDATLGQPSILDTFSATFATYDLTTAIGPITGPPFINPGVGFATTAGTLVLNIAGNSTFTATTGVVPAPSIGAGLPIFLVVGGLLFAAKMFGRKSAGIA